MERYVFVHVHVCEREREREVTQCLILCDLRTVVLEAPLYMEFSRQKYWSGLHVLLQGIYHTQGSNPSLLRLLHFRQILYH